MSEALAKLEEVDRERRELLAMIAGDRSAGADPWAKGELRRLEEEKARLWEARRRELADGGRGARPTEKPEGGPKRGGQRVGECSECGAEKPIQARGMCGACYNRLVRRAKAGR